MKGTYRLGTVAGIEIDVHYTWMFAFALITWTLARSWFPADYPGWSTPTYWLTGAVSAVLLFGSVLVHELAHSLVALTKGMPVRNITLFIFGGVSNIGGDTRSAGDEFQIAVVGPASSLALSAICIAVLRLGLVGDDSPAEAIIYYLAIVNLLVGIFNLAPGFPLDGGRVLRSIIWRLTNSESRATEWASTVGIGFGWLLIGLGVLSALTIGVITGLWTAFIGWYLKDAAMAVRRGARRTALRDVRVRDVMTSPGSVVGPDISIGVLFDDFMIPFGRRSVPVVDSGLIAGIISLEYVQRVRRDLWEDTPVSSVM
ncbi:MAG: site-2 protease family protein, partial [Chloroflexi bacterium]|nr:site-2 protease family protein [Chloroflexota bacterium]